MKPAIKRSMKVIITAGPTRFEATGIRIVFAGFLRAYGQGGGESATSNSATNASGASRDGDRDDQERILPPLAENDQCAMVDIGAHEHKTRPPARYTEATLIQKLEAEGIGRPSTYASIISTLYDRGYVRREGNALIPTFTGIAVIQFLERHFTQYIDYGFTARMEETLDEIARGEHNSLEYLKTFYLREDGLRNIVEQKDAHIDANSVRLIAMPRLDTSYELRIGRYGPYIIHRDADGNEEEVHASIPEEIAPADLSTEDAQSLIETQRAGPTPIGHDPDTDLPIYLLTGRYGPYVQLGDEQEDGEKPRRASVPRDIRPASLTLDDALRLLSLPRTLGAHPDTDQPIIANRGRFGPYIIHGEDTRSLKKGDDVYTITRDRALQILAEPKARRRGSQLLKALGTANNTEVAVYSGPYGPYLKVGKKNIALPEELRAPEKIDALTLDMVKSLLP